MADGPTLRLKCTGRQRLPCPKMEMEISLPSILADDSVLHMVQDQLQPRHTHGWYLQNFKEQKVTNRST